MVRRSPIKLSTVEKKEAKKRTSRKACRGTRESREEKEGEEEVSEIMKMAEEGELESIMDEEHQMAVQGLFNNVR